MKAIVYRDYGSPDVLNCDEIEKPTPGNNEVLLRVHAASINPVDWRLMRGEPRIFRLLLGLHQPKRLGRDVAGRVEAVGRSVTQFEPGDEVFGTCLGALAEYVCTSESALAVKPNSVTFEQAASVPVAAYTALQGLRDKGRIRAGQKVLINGAAGGVGTFAVQIAKSFGADVTGVCSTRNVEMVRSIGADRIIDYTQEDFTQKEQRYDLILDCVGNHSVSAFRRVLKPQGICVIAGAPKGFGVILTRMLEAVVRSWFSRRKVFMLLARRCPQDLILLGELMVAGRVTAVIDRCYRLSEAREAIRYLEVGHARGKVVITLEQDIRGEMPKGGRHEPR